MTLADKVVQSVEMKLARNAHELAMARQRVITLELHGEELMHLLDAARAQQQQRRQDGPAALQRYGDA